MAGSFVLLADTFNAKKHGVAGWFLSEKLDGMRAVWDGGVSRGVPCDQVPWANVEKDGRYLEQRIATGMWSRYGKAIYIPDAWYNHLPQYPLDGELWAGRGRFQYVMSTVKSLQPGPAWDTIQYRVFESPPYDEWLKDRVIDIPNFHKTISWADCKAFIKGREPLGVLAFRNLVSRLGSLLPTVGIVVAHPQVQLPWATAEAEAIISDTLAAVSLAGGEGLMLRAGASIWQPKRYDQLLKVKKLEDAEAVVTGYVWGRETEKGSKLLGLMGALIVDFRGKRLELSGFTDEERAMRSTSGVSGLALTAAEKSTLAGKDCTEQWSAYRFPRGFPVSFKYRELSDAGIPKEARYWRKHGV